MFGEIAKKLSKNVGVIHAFSGGCREVDVAEVLLLKPGLPHNMNRIRFGGFIAFAFGSDHMQKPRSWEFM